jgi:4-hydroxyproline epimerase
MNRVSTFKCIDAHTCGNPVRVVAEGGPQLLGNNMSEKRQHFLREFDWIRKGLMFEPRGHDMMSGSILYPPLRSGNDVGVLVYLKLVVAYRCVATELLVRLPLPLKKV